MSVQLKISGVWMNYITEYATQVSFVIEDKQRKTSSFNKI